MSPLGCPQPHPIVPLWVSPRRPIVPTMSPPPQPLACAPWSAPCVTGATGGDVGPCVTLSPLGCPQPHPIVPMVSHCPPMGVPKVSHCPHDVPPPSAPNLCPTERPMHDGAAGGDVGPGVTLSPSGCPQPHPIVPKVPPHPPAPNLCPTEHPVCNGCHWWRCGAQCHIVTLGLSPTPPRCPQGVPLSPRSPSHPPAPNLHPTEHPMCDGCAMGATGGDVGP